MEQVVFPVILNTLKPNFIDVIDETMEIASIIIYGTGQVSPNMLNLFPCLIKIVVGSKEETEGGFGYEYLSHMLNYFANLIAFGQ